VSCISTTLPEFPAKRQKKEIDMGTLTGDLKSICVNRSCGWNSFSGRVGCSSGDGSCLIAEFVPATESEFHTAELIEATNEIRNVMSKIKRKSGKKLGLLNTPFGLLLAWVDHDLDVPGKAVDIRSSPEKIKKALGLRPVSKTGKNK
jgi:hypothetical protein